MSLVYQICIEVALVVVVLCIVIGIYWWRRRTLKQLRTKYSVSLYSRERGLSSIYAQDMESAYSVADIPRFTQPTTPKERESTFSCPTTPSELHSSPLPPSNDKSELIRAQTITPLSPVFVRTHRVSVVSHHVTPQYTASSPL